MTATLLERDTPRALPGFRNLPIKGSTKVLKGTLCVLDAGYAKGGATAQGLVCVGRAKQTYDNTSGNDGDLYGDFEYGEFRWANSDGIAAADAGSIAWVVDNQTVAKTSTGKSPAGMITRVDDFGVWISTPEDIGSITGLAATSATLSSSAAELIGDPSAGSSSSASKVDHVHGINCLPLSFPKAADAAAGTATSETVIFVNQGKSLAITAVNIYASAAVTADASNTATVTIKQRTSGGSANTIATLTTDVSGGSWTAWTAKSMGSITNATLAAGSQITVTVTKANSGVQLPALVFEVVASTDV